MSLCGVKWEIKQMKCWFNLYFTKQRRICLTFNTHPPLPNLDLCLGVNPRVFLCWGLFVTHRVKTFYTVVIWPFLCGLALMYPFFLNVPYFARVGIWAFGQPLPSFQSLSGAQKFWVVYWGVLYASTPHVYSGSSHVVFCLFEVNVCLFYWGKFAFV